MSNGTGQNNSNWRGGRHTFICENCGREFKRYLCSRNNVRFCSNKCAHGFMPNPTKGKFGQEHPCWKDKKRNTLNETIRHSQKYIDWRMMVFGRDNFTCQECGKRGVYLEAHHKTPFRIILVENNIKTYDNALQCEQLWDVENGITYCRECHIKIDEFRGRTVKGNSPKEGKNE